MKNYCHVAYFLKFSSRAFARESKGQGTVGNFRLSRERRSTGYTHTASTHTLDLDTKSGQWSASHPDHLTHGILKVSGDQLIYNFGLFSSRHIKFCTTCQELHVLLFLVHYNDLDNYNDVDHLLFFRKAENRPPYGCIGIWYTTYKEDCHFERILTTEYNETCISAQPA